MRRISGNLGLATELRDLEEDIVYEEEGAAEGTMMAQTITDTMTTMAAMKSEPTQKVFTETKSIQHQNIFSISDFVVFVKAIMYVWHVSISVQINLENMLKNKRLMFDI